MAVKTWICLNHTKLFFNIRYVNISVKFKKARDLS